MSHRVKRTLALFLFPFFIAFGARAGDLKVEWELTLGGPFDDWVGAVHELQRGGYVVTGATAQFECDDRPCERLATLALVSAEGQRVWSRIFSSTMGSLGLSVVETTDGGFVIAGLAASPTGGGYDVYLLRTDEMGSELWSNTLGGPEDDIANSVQETVDSGYIITGGTWAIRGNFEDMYLIKTDVNGHVLWERIYGGRGWDRGFSVRETSDGGFIVTGNSSSFREAGELTDLYLVKVDINGGEEWIRTFGDHRKEEGLWVQETIEGGYIVTGSQTSVDDRGFAVESRVYLVKVDAAGNAEWERSYGDPGGTGCYVQQTFDGGFIVTGHSSPSRASACDTYVLKTDRDGGEMWWQTHPTGRECNGDPMIPTRDGGYLMAGLTYADDLSDIHLLRLTPVGPVSFQRGDANTDDAKNLSDAVFILKHLFLGGDGPTCMKSADTDDSGVVEITDAVRLLSYLFLGGSAPGEPFAECGVDPTDDELTCESYRWCQ